MYYVLILLLKVSNKMLDFTLTVKICCVDSYTEKKMVSLLLDNLIWILKYVKNKNVFYCNSLYQHFNL